MRAHHLQCSHQLEELSQHSISPTQYLTYAVSHLRSISPTKYLTYAVSHLAKPSHPSTPPLF